MLELLGTAQSVGCRIDGEDPHAADPRRGGVEEEQDELGSRHCHWCVAMQFFCTHRRGVDAQPPSAGCQADAIELRGADQLHS